ncbi:MAG: IS110 family transposase [bacterium]|nr:IS110 family transposase [bacterium]
MDVHRNFAQIAILESGQLRSGGRIATTPEALRAFAHTLRPDDEVVLEATVNTHAIVQLLQGHAGRVVVSNPLRTRAIADAKIKTDKVDAEVLVRLLADGWLPDVWIPDDATLILRYQIAHRTRLVQQGTRLKNRVQAILHRNLVPGCPRSDLFGKHGRLWLDQHALPLLPSHEQAMVTATLRELDLVGQEITAVEHTLAASALERSQVRRLITIPGLDALSALAILAAIGDIHRFCAPAKLVGYFGLDPRVRQSGARVTYGPITKQGRGHARTTLVEAAWSAVRAPGPLRAFYQRLRGRRGSQLAIVAAARKLAVLVWHVLTREQDYAFARPSLVAQKVRTIELRAGVPQQSGRRGSAYAYNRKELRQRELAVCAQAERAYQHLTARWQPRRPQVDAGATKGARR